MTPLPPPLKSSVLSTDDRAVWKIAGFECAAGDRLLVAFESWSARWRQGVWLAVDGELNVEGVRASQVVLWVDTAPPRVEVTVLSTEDGLARFYNVWDSGRGFGAESQAETTGMVREDLGEGVRYRCNDIGTNPVFDSLVFTIKRL